jgi:hypothetical protein
MIPVEGLARQQQAVLRFAKHHGLEIVGEFHNPGVSGKDPFRVLGAYATAITPAQGVARAKRQIRPNYQRPKEGQ